MGSPAARRAVPKTPVRFKAKLFRGLSDPARLSLMEALLDGPKSVGELVLETGLSQPGVSQHLNCLRCCGLVLSRRQGRRVYYRIASPRMLRLLRHADGVLEEVAERIRACEKYQVSSGGRR